MSEDSRKLSWIYEGAKSGVNREDYLLGKKVDKNFELYSDATNVEKARGFDAVTRTVVPSSSGLGGGGRGTTAASTSSERAGGRSKDSSRAHPTVLGVNIVRNEDPLVAIKVKEDLVRREMMDNPVRMKKLQNAVKKAFEKKMRKALKKQMKKEIKKEKRKRQRASSSSSSSSHSDNEKRRRRSRDGKELHNGDERSCGYNGSSRNERYCSKNSGSSRGRSGHSHSAGSSISAYVDRVEVRDGRPIQRHDSDSSDEEEGSRPQRRTVSNAGSADHHHQHRQHQQQDHHHVERKSVRSPSNSDSDDGKRKQQFSGYGLVGVKKTVKKESDQSGSSSLVEEKKFYKRPVPTTSSATASKEPRKKLTAEEMEEKRLEMMHNAKWRDQQRTVSLKRGEERERRDADRDEKKANEAADFINPMLRAAIGSKSLEDRLKSNKKGVQRSYGHMESSFLKK